MFKRLRLPVAKDFRNELRSSCKDFNLRPLNVLAARQYHLGMYGSFKTILHEV